MEHRQQVTLRCCLIFPNIVDRLNILFCCAFSGQSAFGQPAAGSTAFGQTPAAKPLGFGGGFGAAATSTAAPTLGFGTTSGGFGAPATSSAFGAFGKPAGAFGAGTTGTTGGGLFSQPGGSTQPFGAFGQPQQMGLQQQQQQQQQQRANPVEQLYSAVLQCSLFGDERDTIIARWNMLQASWGIGKIFHSTTMPPLDLSAENPLCRFKTIGYSALPSSRNEDGILSAVVKKKAADLTPQTAQIGTTLHGILGNKPTMKVVVDGVRSLTQDTSEILFYVQESNPQNGHTRKVPTNEIFSFLSQPMQAQNLQRNGFDTVTPKVSFTKEQIKEYLENPPQGIDPRLWKQAQLDNPNPKALIPVPMIGFKALQHRIQCQDLQAKTFQGRLDSIAEQISDLQKRHQDTLAKMRDAKRRHLSLSHRVLHVIVKQEETRKIGFSIQVGTDD